MQEAKTTTAEQMAAIVYEGMVGGEGELFAGMKFYVLHRVPMRQTFMDAITVGLTPPFNFSSC